MENSEEAILEELVEDLDENGEVLPSNLIDDDDEEIEPVPLDTEETEILEIDERMPEDLKEQLRKFNKQVENVNGIINGTNQELNEYVPEDDVSIEDDGIEEEDSLEEANIENNIIEEDNGEEIGDLF